MDDEDPLDAIQKALIRKLAPWLIALVGGSTILGGSGVLRIDKYGRSDARLDSESHRLQMEQYVAREIEHAVILLEQKMPPYPTRRRFIAIERWIGTKDPEFEPPTQEW